MESIGVGPVEESCMYHLTESPYAKWDRLYSKNIVGIEFCNKYIGNHIELESDIRNGKWDMFPQDERPIAVYGMPTTALKEKLKRELIEEFIKYIESL